MPTDLHDRATTQRSIHVRVADDLRQRLHDARTELNRRHDTPDTVAVEDWHAEFGAAQHLAMARERASAYRAEQVATRSALAGVATPAEAGPAGAVLRAQMIGSAVLGVEVRHAQERVDAAELLIERLQQLTAWADREVAAADLRVSWGERRQESGDRLRAALAIGGLATVVADAAAARGGAEFTAADDRLDELLPTQLRARAEARLVEAHAVAAAAQEHDSAVSPVADARLAATHPLDGAVAAAERTLLTSEAALEAYVAHATGRLSAAIATLESTAALDDLEPSQVAALDPAGRGDAITALGHEEDLAAAWADVAAAERAVAQAILEALDADPDADPMAAPTVVDAQDDLASAAVQDPLDAARSAYAPLAAALDEWEVEVPATLWDAVVAFVSARRTLDELADQGARDALVTALDDATDMLATALDERDVAVRGDVLIEANRADRSATARALAAGTAARIGAYTRGDGEAGRTASER